MPPEPGYELGWEVYVLEEGDGLRVRSKPSTDADSLKYEPLLAAGSRLTILGGPTAGSGFWWYRVHLEAGPIRLEDGQTDLGPISLENGLTEGWVAAGARDGTMWIGTGGLDCDPEEPSLKPGESPLDIVC